MCIQRARMRRRVARRRRPIRLGSTLLFVVGALVIIALAAGIWFYATRGQDQVAKGPLLTEIKRGPYEHVVIERGEVESSRNLELRCEVKARGSTGTSTTILEVVPEGTEVVPKGQKTKPDQVEVGDILVRLDSSALEQELVQQQILVNSAEALMNKARNLYEAALIAKREYIEGTFKQEEQVILNEIYVAEENLRRAQETAKFSERLAARGYLTPLQLEGDRFSVEKYRNELDAAKTKLRVLRDYTREKMEKQFDSDIDSALVDWENQKESFQLEVSKLEDIKDQIAKCEIRASEPGTVVYANVVSSRGNSEFIVEEGSAVRERQPIIRLPDPKHMQVNAKISESRVTLIKEGMPVQVRIDAFGDNLLEGTVVKVNKYAEPSSWWSSSVKQYATFIAIKDPPPQIRPGLTAEVRIQVERHPEALQIPVQAVFEQKGETYCVVKTGENKYEPRKVKISSTNDKMICIDEQWSDPLSAGDQVVMNPREYREMLGLPEITPQAPTEPGEQIAARPEQDGQPSDAAPADSSGEPSLESAEPVGAAAIASAEAATDPQKNALTQPSGGAQ